MSISKRKHFLPLTVTGIAMAAGILYLAVYLAAGIPEEQREYQEIVSFGKTVYDQKLLKEVQKIDGLVSFTPVQEIPVELRLGEYTMNTVFQAADLAELHMKGNGPDKIQVGNTPALLIGKNALSSMTDGNGRRISKKELQKFWEGSEKHLQYRMTDQSESSVIRSIPRGESEEKDKNSTDMATDTTSGQNITVQKETGWRDCCAAARLTSPSDGIYMDYEQGRRILEGRPVSCNKALLTVQGKENFEKASASFADLEKKQ